MPEVAANAEEIAESFDQFTETLHIDREDLSSQYARFIHPQNKNIELSFTVQDGGTAQSVKVVAFPGTLTTGSVEAICKNGTDAILTGRAYLDAFFRRDG
jgi:hypothetical protein